MATRKIILPGLLIALALAFLLSPFASQYPDGLEKVAEKAGFMHHAEGKEVLQAPMPDYTLPGIKNETISTALAGVVGTLLTFAIMFLLGYILTKKKLTRTIKRV